MVSNFKLFKMQMIHHLKKQRPCYNCLPVTFFFFVSIFCFSSCKTIRPSSYFYNISRDTTISGTKQQSVPLQIKNGDGLSINISSLNKEEDITYAAGVSSIATGTGGSSAPGFKVNNTGEIFIHKLGKIQVAGLTRDELKLKLENALLPYLKDPIVTVNFTNHHVTLIGEVGSSKLLDMPDEKITIIDAMAQSGNVTSASQLTNVMIIREHENSKDFRHVNLEDHSIFTSPYYYLQPNDVVVVNPNYEKVFRQERRDRYQQSFTLLLQLVSLSLIIAQIFK